MKHTKKAFTLLELMIVLLILSILFLALVARVDFSMQETKEMNVKTDFLAYQLAIEQVALENKELSDNMTTLCDQLNIHLEYDLLVSANGGSIITTREDPWGKPYNFEYLRTSDDLGKIVIKSAGVDMTFGTDDDLFTSVTYQNTPYGYKVVKN